MDENGWTYRTAYLQDRAGSIYEATLNIANGRDRRILYDISNIRKIDEALPAGVVPSAVSRGARTEPGNASEGDYITGPGKVNKENAEDDTDQHSIADGQTMESRRELL